MPVISVKLNQQTRLAQAIIKTLAFFSIYELPIPRTRLYQLISVKSGELEFEREVNELISQKIVIQKGSLVALTDWEEQKFEQNQIEIAKKLAMVDKYFHWLSALPFVRQISLINSLAIGNADSESDIDFFVITKGHKLYFVRSLIIVLFRLLGVYKTRQKIANQFCFGFYVAGNKLNLYKLLLKPIDPYFLYWLASLQPLLGEEKYFRLIQANNWIYGFFPNLEVKQKLTSIKKTSIAARTFKLVLECLLWLPASLAEPVLRYIHIRHTFKLPENLSKTSTTVANKDMLKLHAADARQDIATRYNAILQSLG